MKRKKTSVLYVKKPTATNSLLEKTALVVLRDQLQKTEIEVERLRSLVAKFENSQAKLTRTATAAEGDAEALLDAVRVLASGIGSETRAGRRVREQARSLLEARKIQPPHTLGASRNRAKHSKKRS